MLPDAASRRHETKGLASFLLFVNDMVIIFNLWAIPAALAIYLIVLGVERVAPALMTDPRSGWTIGVVVTLVGAVCERVGIKARVFLMPVWMIGLGIIAYHLGWPGTVAFTALLVAGGIWLFRGAKEKERIAWQKLQEETVKAGAPPASEEEVQFWEWVKQMLFLPIWLNFTADLCQHNLKVLRAIQEAAPSLGPDEKVKLEALQNFLTAAQSASKPPDSDMNIQNSIGALIDTRLSKAKRNARRQKLSTPPPLATCR